MGPFRFRRGKGELTSPELTRQGLFLLVFWGYSSFSTFFLLALLQPRHLSPFLLWDGVCGWVQKWSARVGSRREKFTLGWRDLVFRFIPASSQLARPSTPAHRRHPHFRPSSPALPPPTPSPWQPPGPPPPLPPSLPTLAPLPAFYSSSRRPTLSAPQCDPDSVQQILRKVRPALAEPQPPPGGGRGSGRAPLPLPGAPRVSGADRAGWAGPPGGRAGGRAGGRRAGGARGRGRFPGVAAATGLVPGPGSPIRGGLARASF